MVKKIYENVEEDHVGIKPDGIVDEPGPFTKVIPARHDGPRLMGQAGEVLTETKPNRGVNPQTDEALAVTIGPAHTSGVVGLKTRKPSTQPTQQTYGRGQVTMRFFDSNAQLRPGIKEEVRYISSGVPASSQFKHIIEDGLETHLLQSAGRRLHQVDTGDQVTFESLDEQGEPGKKYEKSNRMIPREMPFSNSGGPLFGNASLGWNSIFFYMFKINNTYDDVSGDRWSLARGEHWMLNVSKSKTKAKKKIVLVREGKNGPEKFEDSIEQDEVTDGIIDHDTPLPRNTFERSYIGDGRLAELDDREEIDNKNGGQTVYNPDYMYKTKGGRMPVWRNFQAPEIVMEKQMAFKAQADENIEKSEYADVTAHKEFWSDRKGKLEKHIDEVGQWDITLDHILLHFGNPPKGAICKWDELAHGTYSMRVDAARSGFCGFDLTYPNRYAVGKLDGGEFVKPSSPGSDDDFAQELDVKVLRDTNRNDEFYIYLRPRVMNFAATTIYFVGYINIIFGIPVFASTLWPQTESPHYFRPWLNAAGGGESFMVNGSAAAINYANSRTPVPFDSAAFFGATGGIPITWFPFTNVWNIYIEKHDVEDQNQEDGIPVAVIRKFHKNGGSDLYCIYYFDDGETNPINTRELMFSWAV